MSIEEASDPVERMRSHMRKRMQALAGDEKSYGIEISSLIRMVDNQYEALGDQDACCGGLSAPRWSLLMHLAAEEERGNLEITPTELSRAQYVTKNTISALLRGLEDQGLISRELDLDDRRIFRIQLTPAGRELVRSTAPQRISRLNQLASNLSSEEQERLILLLGKLYCSLVKEIHLLEVS